MKGRSIDKRPDIVNAGTEIGHWEVDTVVGHRNGHEAVVFTAVEKVKRIMKDRHACKLNGGFSYVFI